jgi:hypothetical protein
MSVALRQRRNLDESRSRRAQKFKVDGFHRTGFHAMVKAKAMPSLSDTVAFQPIGKRLVVRESDELRGARFVSVCSLDGPT